MLFIVSIKVVTHNVKRYYTNWTDFLGNLRGADPWVANFAGYVITWVPVFENPTTTRFLTLSGGWVANTYINHKLAINDHPKISKGWFFL